MKRWMVFAGLAVAGIVLALLLLPKPETGEVREPGPRAQLDPEGEAAVERTARKAPPSSHAVGDPTKIDPRALKKGPSPVALENISRMNIPEALYSGRLTSPLAVVRRQLQLTGDPEAEALGSAADALIGELREQRRDPEAHPMPDLIARSRAWLDQVKASRWGAEAEIAPQFARFDKIVSDYEYVRDHPGEPLPPPGGAPGNPTGE